MPDGTAGHDDPREFTILAEEHCVLRRGRRPRLYRRIQILQFVSGSSFLIGRRSRRIRPPR